MISLRRRARRVACVVAALATFVSAEALADKVATLHARGAAPLGERTTLRNASDGGARSLGHETIGENDILQGEGAAGDKIGTSEGLVAIGKVTGADWVVEPYVQSSDTGTRVELKVCQVGTGRVETLARDLDPKVDPLVQMREMLALLLRPQGVGDDPLPWDQKKPKAAPPPEVLPKDKPKPTGPAAPSAPPTAWGAEGRLSLGAAGGVGALLARPDNAVGSKALYFWALHADIALPEKPWLEIVARFGGLHGPGGALGADFGARAFVRGVGTPSLALGAGATVGVFGAFASGIVRPTLALEPTASYALSRNVQAEVIVPLRLAPGEAGALFWTGAQVALLARF